MKKLLLYLLLLLPALPAFPQLFITVNGTVTDSATGSPIANHAVTIRSDSTTGFAYYNVEYTNGQGFYTDTIVVPGGATGILYIETQDCNYNWHQDIWNYMPNQSHTSNFSICNSNAGGCQAFFSFTQNGNIFQFYDQSTGNPAVAMWSWNFGDPASGANNNSTQQNPVHVFSSPGTYNVCLTITGTLGCTDTYCMTILYSGGGSGCQAAFTYYADTLGGISTVHFIDQSTTNTGTITLWTWDFGDGNVMTISFPGNPNVTHTYANPNMAYMACLTIHGSDSTCYDVVCDTVRVGGGGGGCQADFITSVPTPAGSPVLFQDLSFSTGGQITSWHWDFGDPASGTNGTSNLQNPSHTYIFPGTYTVCLTIHGADSTCYDIICKPLIITGDTTGCQAAFTYNVLPPAYNNVQFTDLSVGNPTTWSWVFGDGTTSNIQNPQHTFAAPGTYSVCLTITSVANGIFCTSTACNPVYIIDSVNYRNVYGQVFAGNFPLSLGMAMIFSYDTIPGAVPFVAVTPIDSMGVYYFNGVPTGNYYILAIPFDSNAYIPTYYGNTIYWQDATLITLGTPQNPYNINLVLAGQMAPGPGSASGQINTGDVSSALMDKINMILRNEQGQALGFVQVGTDGTFEFPSLAYGTYYLHPEMPGVTSQDVMITLTAEKPHVDVVMTFTGNSILGIHDVLEGAVNWKAYPNPVKDQLTIALNLKKSMEVSIRITNLAGQMVAGTEVSLQAGANSINLNTGGISSGIYLLKIFSPDGLMINSKLVKAN